MYPVINKRETGIQLRRIMDKKNLTVKDVQQFLGLGSVQSVYHWLSGKSMPTIDNLYALSELFQMSIDEMVCGNKDQGIIDAIAAKQSQAKRIDIYYRMLQDLKVA